MHKKLKIGIFAYNFPHKKTQEGIINLILSGYKPECIFAANKVKLNFYQSSIRVSPKNLTYTHPKIIADKLDIPYYVKKHNDCKNLIKKHDLDLGIVLGARILSDTIIKSFRIGILNLHPGLLPENRGLDNLKWAIIKGYKQGVSCHLIDKEIDRGFLLLKEKINVYQDDTYLDIFLRTQNKEQELMIKSIQLLEKGKSNFKKVGKGNYFKAVPAAIEKNLGKIFISYKKNYNSL